VLILTAVVDGIGIALVYSFERKVKSTDVHTLFDAFFFTTVQLLTVSSQIKNPLSVAGRVVDSFPRGLGCARHRRFGRRDRELLPDRRLGVTATKRRPGCRAKRGGRPEGIRLVLFARTS
jgi:hypothetical protein